MGTFTITFDADGTIDLLVADSDVDAAFFDDCNDAADGVSADYIYNPNSSVDAWLRLENVPSDFALLSSLGIDVDVEAANFTTDTCTLTARIYDSDSGGSENPLTDEQTIGTEADSPRTQRTVGFGSLAGSKSQWDAAYLRLSWTYTGGSDLGEMRLFGVEVDGTYGEVVAPPLLQTQSIITFRTAYSRQSRSGYGAQMLNKSIILSRVTAISEEQTLLFGQDPVVQSGSLASGRWRR